MAARKRRIVSIRPFVARGVLTKVRIYLVVFLVALGICAGESVAAGGAVWSAVLIGFAGGVLVGLVASRANRWDWDRFEGRAVPRFDALGVTLLVLYVLFSLFRGRLVSLWVGADYVAPTSMAVLAGAMLGNVVGIGRGVQALLDRVVRPVT